MKNTQTTINKSVYKDSDRLNNEKISLDAEKEPINKNISFKDTQIANSHLEGGTFNSLKTEPMIWSSGKLCEELYLCLLSIKTPDNKRKYEEQAKYLFYRLAVYIPTPFFIINESDLSPILIEKLDSLTDPQLDSVIREVLEWIFEPINKEYFLLSIYRNNLLQWRFEP